MFGAADVLADHFEMSLGGWHRFWEVLSNELGSETGPSGEKVFVDTLDPCIGSWGPCAHVEVSG